MIRELFYADDVTLLAHSTPDELQQLLDNITLFAKLSGLKVNRAKIKIVVFGTCKQRSLDQNNFYWTIDGQQIPTVTQAQHLGMVFHGTQGFQHAHKQLVTPGNIAMHSLLAKMQKKILLIFQILCVRFFDVLVKPVLYQGAQVWGPDVFFFAIAVERNQKFFDK